MASTLTMYDTAFNDQFPSSLEAVAAYVDGHVGDQPNYPWITKRFPHAHHLSITIDPAVDADMLDIESGAATVESAAGWYARQRARGVQRPGLYASASLMEARIVPVIRALTIVRSAVRLWSAHYSYSAHICGPASCGLLSIDADASQWTDRAMGRDLDESLLLGDFFGTTPPPKPPKPVKPGWTAAMIKDLPVLKQGDQDKPGEAWLVHRAQALIRTVGVINGLKDAPGVAIDGVFGPATKAGVIEVQAHYSLPRTGECDARTWSVLVTASAA